MKSSEIREKFLKYFESRGHKILPGSSLVPSDPTVLLTLAGMLQFKPIFLGEKNPDYPRAATVQKCLRMIDIEKVGKTSRHHTFFEMLGNFSFGDYFKKEAIEFAWELLTKEFNLSADKLLVAVYEKDEEAFDIWEKTIGLPSSKIFRLGEDNNFWAVGPTGPCGPCSEIYYDLGPSHGCGKADCSPGCDCDRFLELWNLVFIQFNRNEKGELLPLTRVGIDTGMGLERIAAVLQGAQSNFETDLFAPSIKKIRSLSQPAKVSETALRIVADHLRAIVHLIADGVLPDNVGRGYVLRRIIRRAVHYGRSLGLKKPFLPNLCQQVIEEYPELKEKAGLIKKLAASEEESFSQTLEQGLLLFDKLIQEHQKTKIIPGGSAFKLHDTYGFPIELTKEIAAESGFRVDEKGFEAEMEKQRSQARSAGSVKRKLTQLDLSGMPPARFVGYEKETEETTIQRIFPEANIVVLESTPFYGESGGQVGDTGILSLNHQEFHVANAYLGAGGVVLHEMDRVEGLKEGAKVLAQIDSARRKAIALHHTATHLLHKALQEVVGHHAKQAGSYVGPDLLRFDFTVSSKPGEEQLSKVEEIVNKKIKEKIKVENFEAAYSEAMALGATALFGEKYGERVRVLKIGDYSLELCGGTHAKNTADLLFFKIISESALGAGVRRIEAMTGQAAKIHVLYQAKSLRGQIDELLKKSEILESGIFEVEAGELAALINAVESKDAAAVKKFLEHLRGRLAWLKERVERTTKEREKLRLREIPKTAETLVGEIEKVGPVPFLFREFDNYSLEMLRLFSDQLQKKAASCLLLLTSKPEGRVVFLAALTPDLVSLGYSAKELAAKFAESIGGRSGGKESKAEGGGGDPAKIRDGFARMVAYLRK